MGRTIDVHNHLFPKEWIDYLGKRTECPKMERKGDTMFLSSHNAPASRISHAGHFDPSARIKDMDQCGIDVQILSLTLPSVEELPQDEGVRWARKINDHFAEACSKYPGRFYANASLPFQDIGEALTELDRARQLGAKGITMFSNVNFKPLSSPEFYPIYAKAEEYGMPIFIHPGIPFDVETIRKHKFNLGLYGFTYDTSMAVMSLIWNGVMEKYPRLNFIHSHLGGVVPYLVGRMEDSWRVSAKMLGLAPLPKPPSEYYKRQVYPDSISGHVPAMRCCLDFVGPAHICLGTDYAHGIGNWVQAIEFVEALGLSEEDTNKILGGNAARIYRIEA